MGDTAYSVLELGLHATYQLVTLITTDRLDAVLHDQPAKRTEHTIGRPSVEGLRLPAPETVIQDPHTHLPASHHGLVWSRRANGRNLHQYCTVVLFWIRAFAYSLDSHSFVIHQASVPLKLSFPLTPLKRQSKLSGTKFRSGA